MRFKTVITTLALVLTFTLAISAIEISAVQAQDIQLNEDVKNERDEKSRDNHRRIDAINGLVENVVPDLVLKFAINEKLNNDYPEKPRDLYSGVTVSDLERLRGELNATGSPDLRRSDSAKITNVEGLQYAKNLTHLNLSENQIAIVPDSMENLKKLTFISLSNNQLTRIPDTIGSLENLISLSLSDNQLTSVPDSMGNLKKLVFVSLDDNQLTSVPDSFVSLVNLEYLALGHNKLSSLPESIGNLSNLEKLYLNGNELVHLPNSLSSLSNLSVFDVNSNHLTDLPNVKLYPKFDRLSNKVDAANNNLFDISTLNTSAPIYAENQTIVGGEIVVDSTQAKDICKNIDIPIRWDGEGVLPAKNPNYTFTPNLNENPLRGGNMCWHNVGVNQDKVSYEFDTQQGRKHFGGTVEFGLNRENTNQIPDFNLQTVINQKINEDNPTLNKTIRLNNDPISVADLESLQGSLNAQNRNILNLTGLEHAKNLNFLRISGNPVQDLTPIAGLPFRIETDKQQYTANSKTASPSFKLDDTDMSIGVGGAGFGALVGSQLPTVIKNGSSLELRPLLATETTTGLELDAAESVEITALELEGTEAGATVGSIEPGVGTLIGAIMGLLAAGGVIVATHPTYVKQKIKNLFN